MVPFNFFWFNENWSRTLIDVSVFPFVKALFPKRIHNVRSNQIKLTRRIKAAAKFKCLKSVTEVSSGSMIFQIYFFMKVYFFCLNNFRSAENDGTIWLVVVTEQQPGFKGNRFHCDILVVFLLRIDRFKRFRRWPWRRCSMWPDSQQLVQEDKVSIKFP